MKSNSVLDSKDKGRSGNGYTNSKTAASFQTLDSDLLLDFRPHVKRLLSPHSSFQAVHVQPRSIRLLSAFREKDLNFLCCPWHRLTESSHYEPVSKVRVVSVLAPFSALHKLHIQLQDHNPPANL